MLFVSRLVPAAQEEVRCDARAVLAAHPGLLVHSLAAHTGPRTAFLRNACGARVPANPAAYLTLSDAAFCAGPGACLVRAARPLPPRAASRAVLTCRPWHLPFRDADGMRLAAAPDGPAWPAVRAATESPCRLSLSARRLSLHALDTLMGPCGSFSLGSVAHVPYPFPMLCRWSSMPTSGRSGSAGRGGSGARTSGGAEASAKLHGAGPTSSTCARRGLAQAA